jgi:YegS/Rv2252/BmrU family lipid kinase
VLNGTQSACDHQSRLRATETILHILNSVFRQAQVDWDISLTKASGDAERFARQAAADGVDIVASYGGDGTVMEVARGLMGSAVPGTGVPLAILPGGSANLMAVELGIPKDLEKATQIIADPESLTRQVDVGLLGESYFLLRVGIGFGARKVAYADRKMKNRFGVLAYSVAAVKALKDTKSAHYRFTLDGKLIEADGVTCLIDNAGNMGIQGIQPAKNISVSDGVLDVLLVASQGMGKVIASGPSLLDTDKPEPVIEHWQARQIRIEVDPPQPVQVDGEMVDDTPISAEVLPGALKVIIPKPA